MEIVITSAEEECPTIFENEKFQNNLRSAARVKKYLEPEFISSCVMDRSQLTKDLNGKLYIFR